MGAGLRRHAGAADGATGQGVTTASFIGDDFIGGDWGTSRLRLFLCGGDGAVLERREGPGIAEAGARAAQVFAGLTADWPAAVPAILGGMVGSTIGWREAAYCACPAAPDTIAQAALRFEAPTSDGNGRRIAIVPGLSCTNASGLFDVMRGEETQLLGALRLRPDLTHGRHLFCLPGTHAKWALIEDGTVTRFQTALSGELFALLSQHSVLARGAAAADPSHPAFAAGVAAAGESAGLLHLLFSTRSRQLAGEIAKEDAASYLSGLIVGAEVEAALRLFPAKGPVVLVCTPALAALYDAVLQTQGRSAVALDGDAAVLAGLSLLHAQLFG
jgi:2-dehydro-3-deoxygalactonokinase